MTSLLKAVYEKMTGSPAAGLATGGIHWGLAPANTPMPYIILRPRAAVEIQYNTGDDATERTGVRVSVFAVEMAMAAKIIEAVELTFVNQELVLNDGAWLAGMKTADDLQLDPDRADDGSEVWQGILDIGFMVQRKPGY